MYVFVLSTLEGGGAELSTVLMANEISKTRPVEIICGNSMSKEIKNLIVPEVAVTRMKAKKFSSNILELREKLSKYQSRHCLVTICNHVSILSYIVHLTTRNRNLRRLIFSERSIFELNTPHTLKGKLILLLARWIYSKPDYIHAISKQVAKSIERVCPTSSKIFVVGNICEKRKEHKNNTEDREFSESNTLRIASMNRLSRDKHVEEQLLALYQVSKNKDMGKARIYLDIYGEGNEGIRLKNLAKLLEVNNYVNFKGYVNHERINWEKVDVVISTSSHEGFGRTVYEALINQKYLIAYNYQGIPRQEELTSIIPFGHTHLLAQGIQDALARKIDALPMKVKRERLTRRYTARSICTNFLNYCEINDDTTSLPIEDL